MEGEDVGEEGNKLFLKVKKNPKTQKLVCRGNTPMEGRMKDP